MTDGLPDDAATIAQLKSDVHDKFVTLTDAVDDQLAADIAAIDPSDPDYAAKVQALVDQAAEVKTQLAAYEVEYNSFIDTYAGKNAETVKAHAEELLKLTGDVDAVLAYIRQAENEVRNAGKTAFDLTSSGVTLDQDTISQGTNYAIAKKNSGVANLDEQYQKDVADLQARLQSGQISQKIYAIEEGKLRGDLEENKAAVLAEYDANLKAIADGIAKASGNAGWGDDVLAAVNARDFLTPIMENIENGTFDASQIDTTQLQSAFAQAFGEGFDPGALTQENSDTIASYINEAYATLTSQAAEGLNAEDAPQPLVDWFNALMDAGGLDGIDTSTAEAQVKIMAGNVGSATVDGYADAIADNAYKANDAATGLGDGSLGYLRSSLDVQSPSKETAKIGGYFVDGMIRGITARSGALYSAIQTLARNMLKTMKQELDQHSPSRKTYAIGLNTAQGYINAIYDRIGAVQAATRRMVSVDGMQAGAQVATAQAAPARGGDTFNIRYSAPLGRNEVNRFSRTLETVRREALTSTGRRP